MLSHETLCLVSLICTSGVYILELYHYTRSGQDFCLYMCECEIEIIDFKDNAQIGTCSKTRMGSQQIYRHQICMDLKVSKKSTQ